MKVPFTPGRTDATDAMTDAPSFDVLEPKSDGFPYWFAGVQRKFLRKGFRWFGFFLRSLLGF